MDHCTVLHFAPRMMRAGQPTAQISDVYQRILYDILITQSRQKRYLSLFVAVYFRDIIS
jgi:hypothetical protein